MRSDLVFRGSLGRSEESRVISGDASDHGLIRASQQPRDGHIRTLPRSDGPRLRDEVVELFDECEESRGRLRRAAEIGRDMNPPSDDDVNSLSSEEERRTQSVRESLLTTEQSDGHKVRGLQEWVADYHNIIRSLEELYDSEAGKRRDHRAHEREIAFNDRLQEIMVNVAHVDLGPRSMVRLLGGPSERSLRGCLREIPTIINADGGSRFSGRSYDNRQRLPQHPRGDEEESLNKSRTASYGDSRRLER